MSRKPFNEFYDKRSGQRDLSGYAVSPMAEAYSYYEGFRCIEGDISDWEFIYILKSELDAFVALQIVGGRRIKSWNVLTIRPSQNGSIFPYCYTFNGSLRLTTPPENLILNAHECFPTNVILENSSVYRGGGCDECNGVDPYDPYDPYDPDDPDDPDDPGGTSAYSLTKCDICCGTCGEGPSVIYTADDLSSFFEKIIKYDGSCYFVNIFVQSGMSLINNLPVTESYNTCEDCCTPTVCGFDGTEQIAYEYWERNCGFGLENCAGIAIYLALYHNYGDLNYIGCSADVRSWSASVTRDIYSGAGACDACTPAANICATPYVI